ncbi:MAG: nitronate monooxygenase, partial [Erythrobacter sp.]|nr:nitronate monooxygenase [Erythrobacter sp.]
HPVRLIANALGTAPPAMIEAGRKHGIPVAALVGAKEHAVKQIEAGVDILIAQGGEGGGHCGEVSTIVLVPEVLEAVRCAGADIPVLAAGGIMNGRQMAGMMAMGAAGAWCGSVWLATSEAETHEVFREKMIAASSRDTIRSKYRTGKYSRQLRSGWHARWEEAGLPALPMPLMMLLSEPVLRAIDKAAVNGNPKARELCSYFVGQGVGLVTEVRSASGVVQDFKNEFAEGFEHLAAAIA